MVEVQWIKLTTDMFDNRKIKHIRKLPEGNSIVLIWVMLLTLAGRCNSNGMIFLTENIPYTPKMLADELGFEETVVQLALITLEQLDMISSNEAGFFAVTGWEEHQNIEGMEKIRESKRLAQARWRAKQKQLPSSTVDSTVDTTRISVDYADKDIDIDREEDKNNTISAKADDSFDRFWKAYPKKVGKAQAKKCFAKVKVPVDTLIAAVEKQKNSQQWRKDNGQYIPNPSTWLNQGRWDDELTEGENSVEYVQRVPSAIENDYDSYYINR